MMDTGGQRKCPHGWDQSTVLGLWQWPWRLIISPQKCSFMLLISCKLVSLAFSVKAIFFPNPVTENPNGDGYDQKLMGVSFLAPSCLLAVTLIDNLKQGTIWDETQQWTVNYVQWAHYLSWQNLNCYYEVTMNLYLLIYLDMTFKIPYCILY